MNLRIQALGAGFLVLVVGFGWLTYAVFTKKFVDYVPVTLHASHAGLQLPALADVKIRGVLVGDVREISADGDGATLQLAIDPDEAASIPADTTALIVPKTLFGEKYVALQVPASPADEGLHAGDVIEQTEVGIEVEQVLSDLYPLLRTVQPAELNYTLNAMATALEGRGDELGESLVVLEDYLRRLNPKIGLLVADLKKLGQVSDVYRGVVPEVANLLRNSVTTGATLVEKEEKLQAFFADVASFSSTSRDFLEQNGQNIIRLSEQGQAQLPLFAKYASEYPCLLESMVRWSPTMESAYRNYTLHINLETLPRQPRGYGVGDSPANGDRRGPISEGDCRAAPGYGQGNLPGNRYAPQLQTGVDYPVGKRPAPGFDLSSGFAGTTAERRVVNSLAGPALGLAPGEVPDIASLLLGPLTRGAEVSLR